jgi:opacity protein-like surface antigen
MNRANFLAPGLSAVLCLWAAGAAAADLPRISAPNHAPPPPPPFSWTGLYIGGHMGGAFDGSNFSNPFGPTLFGDNVRSPGGIGGLQIGYNWQYGATVLGVEADVTAADLVGTFTCLQPVHSLPLFSPGFIGGAFGATCQVQSDWFGTLTGRIGTTFGDHGRTLVYAKGGLAWIHDNVDIATNSAVAGAAGPPHATSSASFTQWGWTVGAGVEYALTGNWSARLEYDFLGFGGHDVATPNAAPITSPNLPGILGSLAPDGRTASVSQGVHVAKLGVNYRFGDNPAPWPSGWPAAVVAAPVHGPDTFEVEIGARYVHGWGRFQADLGNVAAALPVNNSRLTWDGLGTDGAETFWRVDGPYRLMTKGFWGEGGGHSGHINDEDWGIPILAGLAVMPYSNTLDPAGSTIRYLTVDGGYNLLVGPGYRLSPFVGYSHFSQGMSNFNNVNIAFAPPLPGEPGVGLLQFTTWNALRLGAAADLMLVPRLKLSADAAWLPDVRLEGLDIHPLRTEVPSILSPQSGNGRAIQLEATLTYDLTDQFSVGVGGRYWAMWIPDGQTNLFLAGKLIPERYAAEQAAVYLQASYRFGVPCCAGLFQ